MTGTTSRSVARSVGFVVGDTDAMRERLETAGIAFLWDTQRDGAIAWAHVRGPDGAVYELLEVRDR